jgi:hypothetical protein
MPIADEVCLTTTENEGLRGDRGSYSCVHSSRTRSYVHRLRIVIQLSVP